MSIKAVVGGQWGDEGKGKLVDLIAQEHDICARYNGGANAGHTIVHNGKKYKTNLLPSGVITPSCSNLIGNGVVLDVPKLFEEIDVMKGDGLDVSEKVLVSDRAHLVFGFHKEMDALSEKMLGKNEEIGTTKKGIGPAYGTKISRNGCRAGDLLELEVFEKKYRTLAATLQKQFELSYDFEAELKLFKDVYIPRITPMIIDGVAYMNSAIKQKKNILLEGANAVMLDIDFGTYPFVTSSNPTVGGACTGLGIPPREISEVYAVVKAYCTRVGSGPFPTELHDEVGEKIREIGGEFGTTTGRPRRCGWLDVPAVKYGHMLNGYEYICLTKLDVLDTFDEIKVGVKYIHDGKELPAVSQSLKITSNIKMEYETFPGWKQDISKCRTFEELPINAQKYVLRLEELFEVPIKWVGVGAGRDAIVIRDVKGSSKQ
ncbi:adenylosuccinate synthase [Acrasis kona]|uniref:Adenylosuccinate synthetase n=1 Tax=Acrasis kona TaxID=1008807 RepID=A0AAW2YTJ6_9EUKA